MNPLQTGVVRPATIPGPLIAAPTTESVVRTYRRMAPLYDAMFRACFGPGQRRAVEVLASAPGETILEVGVGTGLTLPLWHREAQVTGIDNCPPMLARAERSRRDHGLTNVDLRLMDAQAMSFADNQFDKIAVLYVVSVVPHLNAMLQEIQRICRPGGRIVFVNHFAQRHPVLRWGEERLARHASVLGFNSALPIESVTQAPGFCIRRIERVNWGGYWSLIEAENGRRT